MRYALRKQDKIQQALGEQFLQGLRNMLTLYFTQHTDAEILHAMQDAQPYPVLHVGKYELYCTKQMYNVLHLAYKGTVRDQRELNTIKITKNNYGENYAYKWKTSL